MANKSRRSIKWLAWAVAQNPDIWVANPAINRWPQLWLSMKTSPENRPWNRMTLLQWSPPNKSLSHIFSTVYLICIYIYNYNIYIYILTFSLICILTFYLTLFWPFYLTHILTIDLTFSAIWQFWDHLRKLESPDPPKCQKKHLPTVADLHINKKNQHVFVVA